MVRKLDDGRLSDPQRAGGGLESAQSPVGDPAAQSLSDALRVSFRLLRLIMVGVVIAFLGTGISSIEEQQVGVRKVFGRAVGTAAAGLVYNWPFPIGDIEVVDVREKSMEISDFWMHVAPEHRLKDVSELPIPGAGLRPVLDGALLTGDRNLMHVKLICTFAVRDPIPYLRHVTDLEELIRSVVCAATIHVAAGRTADNIWSGSKGFTDDVKFQAQRRLDSLLEVGPYQDPAVNINAIVLVNRSWPLKARPAYEAAQRASQQRQQIMDEAIAEARKTLSAAAGVHYDEFVGHPWVVFARHEGAVLAEDRRRRDGLIGRYEAARTRGAEEQAAALMGQIDALLVSRKIGGEASKIIAEASAYRTGTIESVKTRAERFNQLLPEFRKAPQFMLRRLWAAAREEILSAPTNEKVYLTLGNNKTVLRVKRDAEVRNRIRREKLKASRQQEQ